MSRIRLSLCMIVRDEETMLPDLLASVDGLWDELRVVDTGSTDGTVPLLEQAGATVIHRPWDDDFAAARNAGLADAAGEWILFLDADERVSPELFRSLERTLEDRSAGAATVLLRNDLPGGVRSETRLLRLFRNDPSVRFRHRIHEDVTEAVASFLESSGQRLVHLPGILEHLGYVRDVAADRDKKERDLALLRQCLADDPDDWYSRFKILELARFWGDDILLADEAAASGRALEAAPDDALASCRFGAEMIVLIAAGMGGGPAAELERLDAWDGRIPDSPPLHLRRGELLETLGRFDPADDAFRRSLDAADRDALPASRTRPLLGRCRLAAAAGNIDAALDLAREALRHSPRDPEALHAAIAFADMGRRLDEFLDAYIVDHGDSVIVRQALGDHALAAGRWHDASAQYIRAAGVPPAGAPAEGLAMARLGGGELDASRELAASIMDRQPTAALGVLVCDLVSGRDLDLDVDIDQDNADRALKRWLDVLWRSRNTEAMTSLLDRMGTVTDIFPWMPEFLRESTDRLKAR